MATAAVSTSLRVCLLLSAGCASASPSTPDCGDPSRSRCASATSKQACPDDMVFVAHRFCIDRYEASMVDDRTGVPFSPYYPPNLEEMRKAVVGQLWGPAALGKQQLQPPVPLLPEWQRSPAAKARAVSRPHVTPQAYLSKPTAEAACRTAGKRLCKWEEWKVACRGEQGTKFPYGPNYVDKACNVHQPQHGAAMLYGDPSLGHWDPRLNQLMVEGSPLLKATGDTPTCRSAWGDDGIYDMVGNLDEWVDEKKATFVGGFYARDTVRGCDARVSEHPPPFFDFSTGARCCSDP
ncbi:MAG TPA: SUMF1/EgtB/PvdO family nonheme iron enzyme [Polyangiaceae bacterium]